MAGLRFLPAFGARGRPRPRQPRPGGALPAAGGACRDNILHRGAPAAPWSRRGSTCSAATRTTRRACARLKALMHDCKVSDAEPTAAYNHVGERDFDDEDEAIARMDELIRLAGRDAIDISVRIKHHG